MARFPLSDDQKAKIVGDVDEQLTNELELLGRLQVDTGETFPVLHILGESFLRNGTVAQKRRARDGKDPYGSST